MLAERAHGQIAGIVLAAGTSSRMGWNKLFFRVGGESLLRRVVKLAIAADLAPVLVVLGHEEERARQEVDGLSCTTVVNPQYADGMHTSLRAGIAALASQASAAVVLLADMPLVTEGMLRTLVDTYRARSVPLVISSYQGVLAPPMLYDRSLFEELGALGPEGGGGRQVVERHLSESALVLWPASALTDLDVPANVETVLGALKPSG